MDKPERLISIETISEFSFSPEDNRACIAERPLKDYDNLPPLLVDDPAVALQALRTHIIGERLGNLSKVWQGYASSHLAEYRTNGSPAFEVLEPMQAISSWNLLFKALKFCRIYTPEPLRIIDTSARSNGGFIYRLADEYFSDFPTIRALGYTDNHISIASLAIRHSASQLSDYIQKYSQYPDITIPSARELFKHDINYPEQAAIDYVLRLNFLREHIEEPVPDAILRKISLRAGNLHACGRLLQQWYTSYCALVEMPAYRGYSDWLLQQAALVKPQYQRRILSSYNAFFNTTIRNVSLDRPGFNDQDRHNMITSPTELGRSGFDPEISLLQKETQQEIIAYLNELPLLEQQAVAQVFNLEALIGIPMPDPDMLALQLGVTDLQAFVTQTILPKLRSHVTSDYDM